MRPKNYTKYIHIRIDPDMIVKMKLLARRHDINQSEYVRRLILNDIKANGLVAIGTLDTL